jgi:hypothetical protein
MQDPINVDVIDVDAEEVTRAAPEPASPEVEIIASRRIDSTRRANPPAFDQLAVEEDDVEFLSENPLPGAHRRHQSSLNVDVMHALLADMNRGRPTPRLQEHIQRRAERQRQATMTRFLAQVRRDPIAPPRARRGQHIHVGFMQPSFDYGAPAFDMGLEIVDPNEDATVRPPTYEAPGKAPSGFTRSPQEEDTLVCPNCGDELCVGESDLKRQVWIVKHCGHVRFALCPCPARVLC